MFVSCGVPPVQTTRSSQPNPALPWTSAPADPSLLQTASSANRPVSVYLSRGSRTAPTPSRAGGAQLPDAAGSVKGTARDGFGESSSHPEASRWNLSSQMTASASPPPSLPLSHSLSLTLSSSRCRAAHWLPPCLTPSRSASVLSLTSPVLHTCNQSLLPGFIDSWLFNMTHVEAHLHACWCACARVCFVHTFLWCGDQRASFQGFVFVCLIRLSVPDEGLRI